jgi:uncharacterized protein YukE
MKKLQHKAQIEINMTAILTLASEQDGGNEEIRAICGQVKNVPIAKLHDRWDKQGFARRQKRRREEQNN